ncbi:MAG: cation:proton antiporter [Microgenomates group bacterium]|jgi:CPA2 family monovalent cation:H+ antiporter-2|nr:cation:proton antiporter [Candidatus Woesebacteria bacterium]QQR64106.1 MAG: cation:proton antiporter [Candidatus Roizmanbacteria bacterium]
MAEVSGVQFFNYFIFLLVPFFFGLIAKRLKLSPIVGYLFGGIVLGNLLKDLVSIEVVTQFAHFGIVLLLFSIGLDLNMTKMFVLKKFVVLGGMLQILITVGAVTFLSLFFGFNTIQSFLIGIALTSSSTTIVAKIIQEKREENSFLGEVALGILMFQDLAFIPFIIIFTYLNGDSSSGFDVFKTIAFSIAEAALILLTMYYVGKRIVPFAFNKIARVSRELLNLFILVFIFAVIALSSTFGVPVLIGAFIAGVLVSQTLEHHHVFAQIRPLRDVMAIVYFVYIGTHVQIPQVLFLLPKILLFGSLLMLIKALILLLIFMYFRFSSRMAFSMSLFLFQVSENAFILLSLAFSNKIFTSDEYLVILSSVLMTLMLTPYLIQRRDVIYLAVRTFLKKRVPYVEVFIQKRLDFNEAPVESSLLKNHIVICGYGRIGEQVGKALALANIPYIAVDYNFQTVEKHKKEGTNIIYGDPNDADVLRYAQMETAAAVVIAVPLSSDQESIILNSKKLNKDLLVISRVHTEGDRQRMKDLGAHTIVLPEFEASLMMIRRIFLHKRMTKDEIVKWIRHIKLVHGAF